jgi:hypothetical protein
MKKNSQNQSATQPDPLHPPLSLLIKLGSIAVHADEYLSPQGHPFDKVAIDNLLKDYEVQRWIQQMNKLAMLPVKR